MSDKKASDGDGAGSVDPWTYQCGKCGADFKTAAERDQVSRNTGALRNVTLWDYIVPPAIIGRLDMMSKLRAKGVRL